MNKPNVVSPVRTTRVSYTPGGNPSTQGEWTTLLGNNSQDATEKTKRRKSSRKGVKGTKHQDNVTPSQEKLNIQPDENPAGPSHNNTNQLLADGASANLPPSSSDKRTPSEHSSTSTRRRRASSSSSDRTSYNGSPPPKRRRSSNKDEKLKNLSNDVQKLTTIVTSLVQANKPSTSENIGESNACEISYSSNLQAGAHLLAKTREKILNDKYIDFYDILFPETEGNYSMTMNTFSTKPAVDFIPKRRRALREHEWSVAFDDFVAIFGTTKPDQLTGLMTYGKFIKKLMLKGHNWSLYDCQFRKDREHSLCPWSTIRVDLQITASERQSTSYTSSFHKTYCRGTL